MSAKTTKFGIEMETFIPNTYRREFETGAYHHGNQIEHSPDGWNAQRDGSLHTTRRTYFPAEVVSPILTGEGGLAEAFYMCEYLDDVDVKVNGSCGLHIHVEASNLTEREIARIKNAFRHFEMAFYGLNGSKAPTRIASGYCAPSERWAGNRYQSLNLTNVGSEHKNTIEIRCFAGTIDPTIVKVFASIPSLPAAVTTTRPELTALSIAISNAEEKHSQPRLKFTTSILSELSVAKSIAFIISEIAPEPCASIAFKFHNLAPGATPTTPILSSFAAAIPAT